MHQIGKSKTSTIVKKGDTIVKTVKRFFPGFDVFENEIMWLKKMAEFDRVPTIIDYDTSNRSMTTVYLGDILTKKTIPADWESQVEYILKKLKKYGCSHNDIKPRDIVVMEGKLSLVDFGWATIIGDPLPESFPRGLGGSKFRYKMLDFNDSYSFKKSIDYILKGK